MSGYGGRGADDGQGYDEQGYDEQGYDKQGYDKLGYDERGRRRPGQPRGYAGQGGGSGRAQGQGPGPGQPQQPRDQGYGSQGYGQDYDPRGYGQPQAPGQGYGSPQGPDQGYGQQGGQPDPWGSPQGQPQPRGTRRYARRDADAEQAWPGDAQQQAYDAGQRGPRRGADPARQPQGGYDPREPRGAAPGRASNGYPGEGYPGESYPGDAYPGGGYQGRGDTRYGQGGQQGWGGDPGPDSGFLPGFGQGEAGGYPGYEDAADRPPRRGRRGRDDGPGGGGGGGWDDDGGTPRRRSTIRRLAPWIALLVILTPLLIGGLYIYHIYENKYHPADYAGPGTGSVTVQVKSGDTAFSLGPRLQSLGVVASSRAFEIAAEQTPSTTTTGTGAAPGLEAGFYKLHMHMQASLAWAALLNPKNRVQLTVTIPEGKRASQVIFILAKETSIPASQFQAVVNDPAQLGLPSYAKGKVEGYLFPATYTIQPNETAAQILKAMVARYNVEAQAINLSSAARAVHLTAPQLITVASLVQAEGGRVTDYSKIGEVIYNRLSSGMKLQFDSTVFYGLGKYGTAATNAEINTPGPYNTYLNTGLPPGPIDCPGDAAIQAALHPARGDLLYFFSFKNGVTQFSPNPIAH